MTTLFALAGIGAGYLVLRRRVDLRRVDDPFVMAFALFSVLWIAGLGLGQRFPGNPQVGLGTIFLIVGSYAAFVLGGALGRSVLASQRSLGAPSPQASGPTSVGASIRWVLALLIVGWALVIFFILRSGGIPFSSAVGEQARVTARAGLGYLIVPAVWLITLPTTTLVARAYASGGRARHGIWVIVLISGALLAVVGNRAPVLVLLLATGWIAMVTRGTLPRLRWLLVAAPAALVVLAIAAMLRAGEQPVVGVFVNRVAWLAYVNDANVQRVVEFFPAHTPFLSGRGYLIDLAVLLPGTQPNFGMWLKEMMGLQFAGGGITIGLTGESYANWGPLATIGISLTAGALLSQVRPRFQVRTHLDASFAVLLSLSLAGIVQSGVTSVLLYSVIPLVVVYVGLRVLYARTIARKSTDVRRSSSTLRE